MSLTPHLSNENDQSFLCHNRRCHRLSIETFVDTRQDVSIICYYAFASLRHHLKNLSTAPSLPARLTWEQARFLLETRHDMIRYQIKAHNYQEEYLEGYRYTLNNRWEQHRLKAQDVLQPGDMILLKRKPSPSGNLVYVPSCYRTRLMAALKEREMRRPLNEEEHMSILGAQFPFRQFNNFHPDDGNRLGMNDKMNYKPRVWDTRQSSVAHNIGPIQPTGIPKSMLRLANADDHSVMVAGENGQHVIWVPQSQNVLQMW